MQTHVKHHPTRIGGSSITEAVILMTVLTPIALLIPYLSQLLEFKTKHSQLIRFIAWEEALHGIEKYQQLSPNDTAQKVLLSIPPIQSTSQGDENNQNHENLSYKQRIDFSSSIYRKEEAISDALNATMLAAQSTTSALDLVSNNSFDASFEGGVRHSLETQIELRPLKHLYLDENKLQFNHHHFIITDHWASPTEEKNTAQVQSFLAWSSSEEILDVASKLGHFSLFEELRLLEGSAGFVNSQVVPDDRLSP